MKANLYLILADIRSTHNVGSLLRTADGLGVKRVFLCGYTPYPQMENDTRLAHLSRKINDKIRKTALGAEKTQPWEYVESSADVIENLRSKGVLIVALEQDEASIPITEFKITKDIALLVGNEVDGVSKANLTLADKIVELPMAGSKESFNVSVAAAMAMFYLNNML